MEISYGTFHWLSREFHCLFHSDSLGDFIVNFIFIPCCFQWNFHSCTLGISLLISYLFPAAFNGFFILVPWVSHCQFHIYSLPLSMGFFIFVPGYFIGPFIWIAGTFNEYFIALKYPKKDQLIIEIYLWYLEWNSQDTHMYLI